MKRDLKLKRRLDLVKTTIRNLGTTQLEKVQGGVAAKLEANGTGCENWYTRCCHPTA